MATPSIMVTLDAEEYSRFESDHDTITATVACQGIVGDTVVVTIYKARRARDVALRYKSFVVPAAGTTDVSFHIPSIVSDDDVPLMRRGKYFIRAQATENCDVSGDSPDFLVSLFTLERFKKDLLFGVDLTDITQLNVKQQPEVISGVAVLEVSPDHPLSWATLTYVGPVGDLVLGGTAAVSSTTTVVPWTGGGLTVSAHVGRYLTWGTESRLITANTATDITVASAFSAAPASGDSLEINKDTGEKYLTWCGGPRVKVSASKSTYVLRRGTNTKSASYIKVRVAASTLPAVTTITEDLLVSYEPMTDAVLRSYIERAISWVEDEAVQVFLEPTRCVTDLPQGIITTEEGSDIPQFNGGDWDVVVAPLSFRRPSRDYVAFRCPQQPILQYLSLSAYIGPTQLVQSFPLEWIQPAKVSGWTELVPMTLATIGSYQGFWWSNWLPSESIPNFWHYDLLAGFRVTPGVLLDLVQKQAVVNVLTAVSQSFGVLQSKTLSRDGVMERLDFTTSAMYNIYSASLIDHNKWIKLNLPRIVGKYRGVLIDAF